MKMKIHISTKLIIASVLFCIGLILVIKGFIMRNDYLDCTKLEDLTIEDIKDGTYVSGSIDSYVAKKQGSGDKIYWSGVSSTYTVFSEEKEIYTIKLADDNYIQFMVISEKKKNDFYYLYNGAGREVYILGKIKKSDIAVKKDWYKDVDEKKYPNIENIVEGYIIEEITSDDLKSPFLAGGTMIVLAIFIFIYAKCTSDGVEKRITDIDENEKRDIFGDIRRSYDKSSELVSLEYELECLIKERKRIKDMEKIMIGAIIVGILYGLTGPVLSYVGYIVGIIALCEWRYCFLNSEKLPAIRYAKKHNVRSVYLEIKRLEIKIQEVRKMIEDDEIE